MSGISADVRLDQRSCSRLTPRFCKCLADPVAPCAGQSIHVLFEALEWHRGNRALDPDGEVNAGITGLTERQLVVDRDAPVAFQYEVLELPAKVRVEAVTGDYDEDRDVSMKHIVAHEQAHVLMLLRLEEAHEALSKIFPCDAEQFVFRKRLEDLGDHLVVVRAFDEILICEDALQLASKNGHRCRLRHVRLGGEQTDESCLTLRGSIGMHASEPDVVHAGIAMNHGSTVGLGDDELTTGLIATAEIRREGAQQHGFGETAV